MVQESARVPESAESAKVQEAAKVPESAESARVQESAESVPELDLDWEA